MVLFLVEAISSGFVFAAGLSSSTTLVSGDSGLRSLGLVASSSSTTGTRLRLWDSQQERQWTKTKGSEVEIVNN